MRTKPSKAFLMDKITEMLRENPALKILDLGSGDSGFFDTIFEKFPEVFYWGIEPSDGAVVKAKLIAKNCPNVRIINDRAPTTTLINERFDIVVSLSVLEHLKDPESFLSFSAEKLKEGGEMFHLYDLGHFLYSSSLRERLLVWLCQKDFLKRFIPDTRFTRYINQQEVESILKKNGINVKNVTYHNTPTHVRLIKSLDESDVSLKALEIIVKIEADVSEAIKSLPVSAREMICPSICIWGRKS